MNAPPRFGRFSLEQMIRSERARLEKVVFNFLVLFSLGEVVGSGPDLFWFSLRATHPQTTLRRSIFVSIFSFLLARTVSALNLVFAFFVFFPDLLPVSFPPPAVPYCYRTCVHLPIGRGGYNLAGFIFRVYSFLPFFFLLVWFILFGV